MARGDDRRDDRRPGPEGENGPSLFLILTVVVAIIAGAFVIQNRETTNIQYLFFFESETKVWVAISFAVLLGVVLDRLVQLWWRRSRRRDDED